ncbi:MAG: peptide ABC transporter substrate-binding protein [Hyphomicrobiales bacterium]
MVVIETMAILKKVVAITTVLGIAMPSAASAGMVYHRGNGGDPGTLDPHKASTGIEINILRDLYEGLVTYDAAGHIYPGVAESWKVSADGTVYTFHFRENAKWSNGEPVTPRDFVFSLRRVMDPATASEYASAFYPIMNARAINTGKRAPSMLGVRAIDDKTLEIRLSERTPYFIELLALPTAMPVYPPGVENYGDDFVKPGKMISNGAYTLKNALLNAQTTVVRNPYFHDAENVAIDTVIFIPTEDHSAALKRFSAGELESNWGAPQEQVTWMRNNLGRQFHVTPRLSVEYYAINTRRPPLDDVRVRKALSMMIDREFLTKTIMKGTTVPAYSFVPPGIPNYGAPEGLDFKDEPILNREDEALELMKDAGYGPGHPLELTLRYSTSENYKNIALAVADLWKPLGVDVSLINADAAAHYAVLKSGEGFDIGQAQWGADYADAQNFLFLVRGDNPAFNYAGYANPQFDVLMNRAAQASDPQERIHLLHRAEQLIERDEPNIALFYSSSFNLVADRLKGWRDNGINTHLSRWMRIEP